MRRLRGALTIASALTSGCEEPARHECPQPASSAAISATAKATSTAPLPAQSTEGPETTPRGEPASDGGGTVDASATEPEPAAVDWENKQPHISEGEDLTSRARGLFEAIAKDNPTLGESFWFPKEPFIPLKDVKGPDRYWEQLHRMYANDIHALHRKRSSWEGATFDSYRAGSTPSWVKPGDEVNKIGYFRSYHGKIAYSVGAEHGSIDVHTLITWQGRWFVTHLTKMKH
jgi:hypothetical protein